MYLRLVFWTMAIAYTSALFSRGANGSSPSIMLTAAVLGAAIGFALGNVFVNRRARKRGRA
jgi:small-conductance mechanosensitive channel